MQKCTSGARTMYIVVELRCGMVCTCIVLLALAMRCNDE